MSNADKGFDLAVMDPNMFLTWYRKNVGEANFEDEQQFIESLYATDKSVLGNYFDDGDVRYSLLNDPDAPPFLFMDFEEAVFNKWMIHFTDSAYNVALKGFKYGTPNLESLPYTRHTPQKYKTGGYNFAYDLDDLHYAFTGKGTKYGKEAVMFQATGIKVYHHGDEEPQVIFWGETARNFVPILVNGDTDDWAVGEDKEGFPVYHHESLDKVVDWVVANFNQYKGVLIV
ncbi:MAG: hypothetical protein WC444_04580 [Candidatus Paceibacterota bacterium]